VWAVNPGYSFNEIKGEILKGLVVYYLVYFCLNQEDHFKQIYMALIFGNLLMVSFDLLDFYSQGGNLYEFTIRARSLHSGYGSFGTYLITVFPFLLIGSFSPLLKKIRWALWGLILLNLFCIYITFGRAMWLAVAVEVAVLGLIFKRKRVVLILAGGLLAFFFLIPKTVWFHGEKVPSVEEMTSKSMGGTAGDLVDVWKFSLAFLQEKPFQGIGFGRQSFSQAFTDFRAKHQPLLWHAHNTFLDIFFQTGVQGLAIFLWLVISILYYLFLRSKEGISTWPGLISLAGGIMVVGFFTRNFFDDFYIDDNALLFWFLVGAALSGGFRKKAGVSR
jgi:O-antigen ligase